MKKNIEPCFIDTNILVYATFEESEFFDKAIEFLEGKNFSLMFISRQIIFEYLRTVTSNRLYQNPLSIKEALSNLEIFLENISIVPVEANPIFEKIKTDLIKYKINRDKIFDYQIILTMKVNSIQCIATANEKDFAFCKDIKIINPFKI
ncbi:MAG: type II toxin-antitoxin system VapC family toxin [Brevinematia bacterium]